MRYTPRIHLLLSGLCALACLGACSSPAVGAAAPQAREASDVSAGAERTTPPAQAPLYVHFIDVGQGAATLLEFACGAVLIDTGGERQPADHRGSGCPRPEHTPPATFDGSAQLIEYLRGFFARRGDLGGRLDALYLTHPHVDHTRGAPAVMAAFEVGALVTNGQEGGSGACEQREAERLAREREGVRVVHVANPGASEGLTSPVLDPVACGDVDPELRVLFGRVDAAAAHEGWSATELRNENEHSVVVHLRFGRFSALFMGDLERQGIEDLLRQTAPEVLDVDLLQVGHHGASNATTEPLLRALTPVTAVIPSGSPTREESWSAFAYGHPRRDVVTLLAAQVSGRAEPRSVMVATGTRAFEPLVIDAAVFATGWDGDVVIRARADGTHERLDVASVGSSGR